VLDDLRAPPGDRFEKRRGRREGQFSIRVNDQWRVCFRWSVDDAEAELRPIGAGEGVASEQSGGARSPAFAAECSHERG
jgi:hypothetical protein